MLAGTPPVLLAGSSQLCMLGLAQQQEITSEHHFPLCIASCQELFSSEFGVVAESIPQNPVYPLQEPAVGLAVQGTAMTHQPLSQRQGVLHESCM